MGKRKPRKAIAYVRVSTSGQAKMGGGLLRQRESIDAYARAAGYEIAEVFSDNQSAVGEDSLEARPDLQAAINKSLETGWPILVDGLDRFSRHTAHLEKIIRERHPLVISTQLGENPQHAIMMADARRAQVDGERISRTTKEGLAKTKAKGTRLGNPTNLEEAQQLGVATNQAKADEHTRKLMPIIEKIREAHAGKKVTVKQLAEELNLLGHVAPRGGSWTAASVRPQLERIARFKNIDFYSDNPNYGMF